MSLNTMRPETKAMIEKVLRHLKGVLAAVESWVSETPTVPTK